MLIDFSAFSNIGPRSSNQDRFLLPQLASNSSWVTAIADGMGGTEGGGDAAQIAIESAAAFDENPAELDLIFSRAVAQMQERAAADAQFAKMGTTLSVALIRDGIAHIAHVGDTRIYHIRGAGLKTITEDQTEVAELRRKGILSESQARRYPRRNVLLSALSPEGNYIIYRNTAQLQVGDRLILLSDGVHQRLRRGGMLNASLASANMQDLLLEIEQRVCSLEPSDNFSAVGLEIISY